MKIVAVIAFLLGCGSGGGGGGDDDDTPNDGPVVSNDGPPGDGPASTSPLGTTCTPDANNPQGSCPVGFECLNLEGATNPWCSKTCQMGAGDTCATGYPGPGRAACILTVTPEGGGAGMSYCSVICQDLSPNNGICQPGQCDGTCPGSMMCTGDIANSGTPPPAVIGKACE
jgi:hypothetical protein